jgi:hypothetical protein
VVGMAAGVLRGAPVTTVDLDIVHRRGLDNVSHLLEALAELQAVYRHDPRRLRPRESRGGRTRTYGPPPRSWNSRTA